jgi:hypothetical protein
VSVHENAWSESTTATCEKCGGEFHEEQPRSLVANCDFFCASCTDELLEMDESMCDCDGAEDAPYLCLMHRVKYELAPQDFGLPRQFHPVGSRR